MQNRAPFSAPTHVLPLLPAFVSTFLLVLFSLPLPAQEAAGDQPEETELQQTLDELDLSRQIEEAFLKVPRRYFLPEALHPFADEDQSIPLSSGTVVPGFSMAARLVEELSIDSASRVLVYGRGCGFFAAVTSTIAGEVEVVELTENGAETYPPVWEELGLTNISLNGELPLPGDLSLGETGSPGLTFDAVLLHGGTERVPVGILSLVDTEGRLIAPLTDEAGNQVLFVFQRREGEITVYTGEELYFPPGRPLFPR